MHSHILALHLEWLTNHWAHCTAALLLAGNIGALNQNQFKKMQTLELNKMGLLSLSSDESLAIEGGRIPWKKIWDGTKWVVEKAGIIDFFSDVWDGIKEGYNDARK